MHCNICLSKSIFKDDGFSSFLGVEPKNEVLKCAICSLLFRKDLPDVNDNEKKRIESSKGLSSGEYTAGTDEINVRLKRRLDYFNGLLRDIDNPSILDIGAGTGSFVKAAKQMGLDAIGTELSDSDSRDILKLDIISGTHHLLDDKLFDLIHINHVLEHVEDPTAMLAAIDRYLKPGGYLCVEVPNEFFSLATRVKIMLGIKYNSSTAYFGHRYFFSAKTLTAVISKFPSLEMVSLKTPYIAYDMDLKHRIMDRLQSSLRMGAVLECVCRKRI